jgi:hypothetical protein
MELWPLASILLVAFGAAALPFALVERSWRWRWREVEIGRLPVDADGGLYREGGSVPSYLRRAPAMVRAAAFTCLFFGQMFVPGLALGAFGLLAGGLGVVSIPGLIVAFKLYSAGLSLLRREPPDAYWKLRDAVAWALWLNGLVFGISLLVMLVLATGCHSQPPWPLFALINGYGALSVAQALLCRAVARRYEDALFQPTQAAHLLV